MSLKSDPRLAKSFFNLGYTLSISNPFRDVSGSGLEIMGLNFRFDNIPGAVFFTTNDRLEDVNYVAAQLSWYSKRKQELLGIQFHNWNMWKRVTMAGNKFGKINSNYGEYVFGEGQLNVAIDRLVKNTMSRQAVVLFNRPSVQVSDTNDHICTTSLQFLIRNDKVHCVATMRSNELWNGFRYDVAFFTFLMDYVRAEVSSRLGRPLTLGSYFHNVGSFHVYDHELSYGLCSEMDFRAEALVFPPLRSGEGPEIVAGLSKFEDSIHESGPRDRVPELTHYDVLKNLIINSYESPAYTRA